MTMRISGMVKLKCIWKPLLGAVGLVVIIIWTSGVLRNKVAPGTLYRAPGFSLPADAATFTVRREPLTRPIELTGTVVAEEQARISSRLNAHVTAVFVGAGAVVEQDELLVTLDDRELREQLAGAEAQWRQAESEYSRAKQLFENQATTSQALTAAESMYHTARAQVDRVKVMLSFTEIRSPFAGIVIDRRIEAGDLAHPGQVLLAVYNPHAMRLDVPAPVRLVDRLPVGAGVTVELERPAGIFTGHVSEIVSEIDPASRTRLVKVLLEGTDAGVLPGTFGRLRIAGAPREGLLAPVTAVYRTGQLELVQVVRDGRVTRRLVKTGTQFNGDVEILSGLDDGEVIMRNPELEN